MIVAILIAERERKRERERGPRGQLRVCPSVYIYTELDGAYDETLIFEAAGRK
jgi:hypothetical protein